MRNIKRNKKKPSLTISTNEFKSTSPQYIFHKTEQLLTENAKYKRANKQIETDELYKDQEIEELSEKLSQLTNRNYDLDFAVERADIEKVKVEKEEARRANYVNDLLKKFSNTDETIKTYEENIELMKKENEKLLEQYDTTIDEFDEKNGKIVKRIDDRIDAFEGLKMKLVDINNKVSNVVEDIQRQKITFEERKTANKIKYIELEKKLSIIQTKIYDKQVNEEIKKAENAKLKVKAEKDEFIENDIQKQIDEYERKNQQITAEIERTKNYFNKILNDDQKLKDISESRKKRFNRKNL